MAKTVQDFIKKVEKDEKLRKAYSALCKELGDAKLNEEQAMPKVFEFAKKNGAQFSMDDLKAVTKKMKSGELSDEQLEGVAGGKGATIGFTKVVNVNSNTMTYCFIVGLQGH